VRLTCPVRDVLHTSREWATARWVSSHGDDSSLGDESSCTDDSSTWMNHHEECLPTDEGTHPPFHALCAVVHLEYFRDMYVPLQERAYGHLRRR